MIPRSVPIILKVVIIVLCLSCMLLLFTRQETTISLRKNSVVYITEKPVLFRDSVTADFGKDGRTEEEKEDKAEEPTTTTTPLPPTTTKRQLIVRGNSIKFKINHQELCEDPKTYLMIYIHSDPENVERRRTVRNTWASKAILEKHSAKLLFITGLVKSENTQAALENENDLHKDIIQGNFTDSYRNLTYKAITGLRWISEYCSNAAFVLKTDDDIVVDIHRVVRLMRSYIEHKWGKENLLIGYVWPHMNVERNVSSKWYTSEEEYPKDYFLKYCSGSAFIMSTDVVKKFYKTSLKTPFFWIDDYYVTGMLARSSNISAISLNDRYILENNANIIGSLKNDTKTRLVFIHSPNAAKSRTIWQMFLDRW